MSDSTQPPKNPPAGFYPDGSGAMRWWDGTSWTEHLQAVVPPAPAELPPPGWHLDPSRGNQPRYWDGRQWTDDAQPDSQDPVVQQSETVARPQVATPQTLVPQAAPGDGPAIAWIKNHKGLTIVAGVIAGLIVIGSLMPSEDPGQETASTLAGDSSSSVQAEETDDAPASEPPPSSEPESGVSRKQQEFIDIVKKAQKAGDGNEFEVVNARKKRGREICALMPALKASNWVGEVEDASTEMGGDSGVVMVRLTDDIAVGTWNNSLSDIEANSLIKPSSPLYDKLGGLKEGDSVTFSGRFVRGPDCLEEQSLVDENGVLTPDFTFKFSSIS